jgi:phage protein D
MSAVLQLHQAGQPFYVPAFEVEVNGSAMPRNVVRDIADVTFEDSIEAIDSFTFLFSNWDTDNRRAQFVGQDAEEALWRIVQPGNGIRLSMGYQGARPDFRVMTTGYITSLEADFPEAGAAKLTVRGLNVLDRFRAKQYTWSWPADGNGTIRDSEVARELGNPPDVPPGKPGLAGVKVRISDKALARERPQQHVFMNNQYPIVFLLRLARRNGYDLFLTRDAAGKDELYFGPSRQIYDRTYVLEWGKSLTSLKASISTARQVKKLTVLGWDRVKKQAIKGEATVAEDGGDLPPTVRALALANGREELVVDQVVANEQEAKTKAVDLLYKVAASLVEVEGVVVGLPDLRAGRTVVLDRVGPRLRGTYFVTSTRHVINDSGYRTTFKARMEGKPAVSP